MIRRRKAEVLPQLPSKRRQQLFLSLPADDAAKIKRHANELSAVSGMGAGGDMRGLGTEQMLLINKLYMATAEAKIKAVQEYVRCLLEGNEESKFLVFAHHKCLLDGVEEQVARCKVRSIRIDGATDPRLRDDLRKRFQEDPATRIAVLSIRAAGTGLTLTAASTVIFAEMTYVPGEIQQAEDRVHRIGQTNAVNITFLMARNSIDEMIWASLQSKLDSVGKTLDGRQESLQIVRKGGEQQPRGQTSMDTFVAPQQQQVRQGCQAGAAGDGDSSPGDTSAARHGQQQATIQRFFPKTKGESLEGTAEGHAASAVGQGCQQAQLADGPATKRARIK